MSDPVAAGVDDPAGVALGHLAAVLARPHGEGGLSPGDRAELRRMDAPDGALPPPMWRLLTAPALGIWLDGLPPARRERGERALAVVAQAMLDAGTPGEDAIGKAMARTGYAEQRFTRLLRAAGLHAIAGEALAAARWCGVKSAGLSFTARSSFGRFILDAALAAPGRDRRAHAIARDYYAKPAPGAPATPNQPGPAGVEG